MVLWTTKERNPFGWMLADPSEWRWKMREPITSKCYLAQSGDPRNGNWIKDIKLPIPTEPPARLSEENTGATLTLFPIPTLTSLLCTLGQLFSLRDLLSSAVLWSCMVFLTFSGEMERLVLIPHMVGRLASPGCLQLRWSRFNRTPRSPGHPEIYKKMALSGPLLI
jgi:hypothetical protein